MAPKLLLNLTLPHFPLAFSLPEPQIHVAVSPREHTSVQDFPYTHFGCVTQLGAVPVSMGFVQTCRASTYSTSSLGDTGLCLREAVPVHCSLFLPTQPPQRPAGARSLPGAAPGPVSGRSCLKRGCNLGLPVPELLAFLPPSQGKTVQAPPYPTSAPLPQQAGRSQINTCLPDSDPSPMVLCETCINVTPSTRVGFLSP